MTQTHAREDGGALASALLAWLALGLVPLALRAVALFDVGARPSAADLHGALADAAVAAVCAAALWWPARKIRAVALGGALLMVAIHYANYEVIRALRAVASFEDATFLGDATFVGGSVLAPSRPLLLVALCVFSGAAAWRWLGAPRPRVAAALALAGAVLSAGAVSLGTDPRVAGWRQVSVLAQNALWLTRAGDPDVPLPAASAPRHPELLADLGGEPLIAAATGRPNVLLVVLEGVSGAELASAARAHGRHAERSMPRLDAIFSNNIGFTTFINHNRRTDRGLYALLCGELPNLGRGLAKMTVNARRPERRCLPERLRAHGYTSVYLQAAPLAFMGKDRFLPRAGFSRVLGTDWFDPYDRRSFWGVDDRTFFDGARSLVRELRAERGPWFLTLLSVGTHHPYVVPRGRGEGAAAAFAELDAAIGEFVTWLEAEGVRDETLILITSDESAGLWPGTDDDMAATLTQNWGLLVALLPGRERMQVEVPAAQFDVALSVLDYLGLGAKAEGLQGRSLLRRYPAGRHLFFGNVNLRSLSAIAPDGYLLRCRAGDAGCSGYDAFSGNLFAPVLRSLPPRPELEVLLREVAAASQPHEDSADLVLPLLAESAVVVESREWQLLHGTPLSLRAEEWLEVELELRATGDGAVEFEHALRFPRQRYALRAPLRIAAGETLVLRYTLAPGESIARITCDSQARLVAGRSVELDLGASRLVMHRGGEAPPAGVNVARHQGAPAERAGGPAVMSSREIDSVARSLGGVSSAPR